MNKKRKSQFLICLKFEKSFLIACNIECLINDLSKINGIRLGGSNFREVTKSVLPTASLRWLKKIFIDVFDWSIRVKIYAHNQN